MVMRCLHLSWGSQWASLVTPGRIIIPVLLHHSWHEHLVISRLVSQLQGKMLPQLRTTANDLPAGSDWHVCWRHEVGPAKTVDTEKALDEAKNSFTYCSVALDCWRGKSRKRHLLGQQKPAEWITIRQRKKETVWMGYSSIQGVSLTQGIVDLVNTRSQTWLICIWPQRSMLLSV